MGIEIWQSKTILILEKRGRKRKMKEQEESLGERKGSKSRE